MSRFTHPAIFTNGSTENGTWEIEGGTLGETQPTFNGDPLFSGEYKILNGLCYFYILVNMSNITNFGTGQYFVKLPFVSKHGDMFREGCLHDTDTNRQYHISGHVDAGSDIVELYTTDISGQNLYDFPFNQSEPITLSTADTFHISGTYSHDL
jgi:hypothetical protein